MSEGERMTGADDGRFRSVAQLDMLHSLAAKLNALGDVAEIGAAITAELQHDHRLPQLPRVPDRARRRHPDADRVPRRVVPRVRGRDARGADHQGRRRPDGPRGRDRRITADAERPRGRVLDPDRGDRRHRRIDAPGPDEARRPGHGRDRALEPRLRQVRRGGPAPSRGARLPCRGGVRERHACSRRNDGRRRRRPPCCVSPRPSRGCDRSATSCRRRWRRSRRSHPAPSPAPTCSSHRRAPSGSCGSTRSSRVPRGPAPRSPTSRPRSPARCS